MDNQVESQFTTIDTVNKQPETTPSVPTELERIAQLRKQLGLPEKSPLLDIKAKKEEKRRVVDKYLQEEQEKLLKEGKGYIDKDKKEDSSYYTCIGVDRLNLIERFNRQLALKGLPNVDDYVRAIYKYGYDGNHTTIRQYYAYFKDKAIVKDLQDFSPEQLDKALDRINFLGYRFTCSNFFGCHSLRADLKLLGTLEEDKFQAACQELNKYTFLKKDVSHLTYSFIEGKETILNSDLDIFLKVASQGGLNPEQKQRLDFCNRFALSSNGCIPQSGKDGSIVVEPSYASSLKYRLYSVIETDVSQVITEKVFTLLEDVIYDNLINPRKDHWGDSLQKPGADEELLNNLFKLNRTIPIDQLVDLMDIGFEGSQLYPQLRAIYSDSDQQTKFTKIASGIRNIQNLLNQNQEAVHWIALMEELLGSNQLDLLSGEYYQDLYQQRDFITNLALAIKTIPGNQQLKLDQIISREEYRRSNETGWVRVDTGHLANRIKDCLYQEITTLNKADQKYIRCLEHYFLGDIEYVTGTDHDKLSLFLGISKNREHLDDLFDDDLLPRAEFLEAAFSGKVAISDRGLCELTKYAMIFYSSDDPPLLKVDPKLIINRLQAVPDNVLLAWLTKLSQKEEVLQSLSKVDKVFCQFLIQQPSDLLRYVRTLGRKPFCNRYIDQNENIDIPKFQHDFFDEVLLTPELIGRWETLTNVFNRLASVDDNALRTMAYLKIAEALSINVLTGRTEVEALAQMQVAFNNLYRSGMTDYEKRTWNILRKQLPFATDERVREDMRNQAVSVEQVNQANLSWVHQAVHNYVRAQTPDYIRALRDYLQDGSQTSKEKLQKFAAFYTPDSKPGDNFYTEEIRQSLQPAIPAVENLVSLTESYYDIQPEKLTALINGTREWLTTNNHLDILRDLEVMQRDLEIASEHKNRLLNDRPRLYLEFLTRAADVREKLLELAVDNNSPDGLLFLDATISSLYKNALIEYLSRYVEPKLKANSLTPQDVTEELAILRNTMKSAMLEGDFGLEKSMKFIEDLKKNTESIYVHPGYPIGSEPHALRLLLTSEEYNMNSDWSSFIQVAQGEMIEMLRRMGKTEEEAQSQAIMQDLVRFEKSSYKFILEPLLKTTLKLLEQEELKIPSANLRSAIEIYNSIFEEHIIEGQGRNETVDNFINSFVGSHPFPSQSTESKVGEFFSSMENLPEVQADKLCSILVNGYIEPTTGQRKDFKVMIGKNEVELCPFSYFGVNGVIMLIDGQKVENPLEKIKELYKSEIVPAMIHSLREGD